MNRTAPRVLATLAAALLAVPLAPAARASPAPAGPVQSAARVSPALASSVQPVARAEPAKPALTWSVQPADQRGPDGRRWIEHTLDPGKVLIERLAVRNFSDRAAVFALKAADGYLTDKGRFNMLQSHQKSVDGGTWVDVQDKVTVGAGETKVVPFTITVPRDAAPGDHPAGIAATVTSTGGTVAVESRVGFRVMLRVSGTVTAALAVDGLTATYRRSWNPFRPGAIEVRYTATNSGNVATAGTVRATTTELFGLAGHDAHTPIEQLLPGGGRAARTRIGGVWALGRLHTTVSATPGTASASVTVWAVPWPQLALVLVLGALVAGWRIVSRRRRRQLARLLEQAREEGRASARS